MKKKLLIYAITSIVSLHARELRTPIPLLRHILHVDPLHPTDSDSLYHWWAGYYQRKTDKARCNITTNDTSEKTNCTLSQLMFCKENFAGNDFFANSMATAPFNILFSTEFAPRYELIDRGLVLGFVGVKALNCQWNIGGRIIMPLRSFQLKRTQGPIVDNQLNAQLLTQTVAEDQETIDGATVNSYAYRLDFLSQLPVDWQPPGSNFKLVEYVNENFVNMPITIANQDVTDNPTLDPENRNPVTVIKRVDGSVPNQPFGLPIAEAQALFDLPGDGFGVPNNDRRLFFDGTNYAPLGADPAQQMTYWVVPTVDTANDKLVDPAQIIKDQVDQLIDAPATAIEQILSECNIDFASQKQRGLGDIDTQLFVQYWWNECSFVEGDFGIRLPTAGVLTTAGRPDQQSLGNNGHPELALGARIYLHDNEHFLFQANSFYSFVLNRSELVATPFAGAQVKNIGPSIPADVHWQYFTGHAEAGYEFCFSQCDYGSIRLGYELYAKGPDAISFDTITAKDCLGTTASLSPDLLEKNTKARSHKLYTELEYHHAFDCMSIGFFVGGTGLVGGFNIPKDNDWYLGFEITL